MPAVQRKGDANSAGGIAQGGENSVLVDGRPVVAGSVSVSPHPCCPAKGCIKHCAASTVPRQSSVFAAGKRIVVTGNADTCGHSRAGGSTGVFIGA